MRSLDEGSEDAAYLCGRLLAILDAIQYRALAVAGKGPNRTMVDAYYGGASGTPKSTFPVLLRQSQHHLSKMRRDPRKEGAAKAEDRRLTELLAGIEEFPATLNLNQQGMFALGFYHQKAAETARREAVKAAKQGNHSEANEGQKDDATDVAYEEGAGNE